MGEAGTLTLRPVGLTGASEAVEVGRRLVGGGRWFSSVEAVLRRDTTVLRRERMSLAALEAWGEAHGLSRDVARILDDLTRAREGFAGLSLEEPVIMGIINVTPDSFSDGGDRFGGV